MTSTTLKRSLATAAVLAAGALAAAAPAGAQERFVVDGPYTVQQDAPQGIIAILIGLTPAPADPRGFTPPIGSDKGS